MPRKYLYFPAKYKGGNISDFMHSTALPVNASYGVTKDNAYIVPQWAREAGVPIPLTDSGARVLKDQHAPGTIVPVDDYSQMSYYDRARDYYNRAYNTARDYYDTADFNSLAALLMRGAQSYMDAANRRREPLWKKALRLPLSVGESYFNHQSQGTPVNRATFLSKAAPIIGTVANAFVPGWGPAITSGLRYFTNGLSSLRNRLFGSGKKKKKKIDGRTYRKGPFLFSPATREYLGSKVSLKKDVEKVSEETLKEKMQNKRWRKVISSAFATAIKNIAPEIEKGGILLGRKLIKRKLTKMGGSASDRRRMAWVRSFIGRKRRGRGLRGGSKLRVYMSHGLRMALPSRRRRSRWVGMGRRRRRRRTRRRRRYRGSGFIRI